MKKYKILVTGGAGFIGSFLVDKLIQLGHSVTIFDNLEHQVHQGKKPQYLNPKAEFIKADVRHYDKLKKALKNVEIVFHEAAAVGVAQSNYEIKRYVDVNIGGTANLLDMIVNCSGMKVKKIMITSSMTIYSEGCYACPKCGIFKAELRPLEQLKTKNWQITCPQCQSKTKPVPIKETALPSHSSIYALTKKFQDELILLIAKMYQIPAVALRCFNVYGPRQSISNPYTGVTAIFISRLKNNQQPVIYEDGLQTRDFISVHDVVNGLILAMNSNAVNYQIINIATGKPTTIKKIALLAAELMNKHIKPRITHTFRKNDIRHCFADITKAKKLLNWQPKISLNRGMKELIDWSKTQTALDNFQQAEKKLLQKKLL